MLLIPKFTSFYHVVTTLVRVLFPCEKSTLNLFNWVPSLSAGGDNRDRTDDPLLAKQVLSQLSYTPVVLHFSKVH